MKSKLAIIAVGVTALLSPLKAMASTAANTVISNTATVNYQDSSGAAQTAVNSAAVTVTVTLVASAPLFGTAPANTTTPQGTPVSLSYTVTGTANGQDTYNLTYTVTPNNVTPVTVTVPATVQLGGTTLAVAANVGDSTITVPNDSQATTTINGIGDGLVIVIGGNPYTVATNGVTKNAAANTATIKLTTSIAGAGQAVGTVVGEQKTFSVSIPTGNVTGTNTSGTQTVSTKATSQASASVSSTQAPTTVITVTRPLLTVAKLVSVNSGPFGATGTGAPGATLTYQITATNGGTTTANAVSFVDVIPPYLTYVAGSAKVATSSATTYSAATALTDTNSDGDGYSFAGNTVTYAPAGAAGQVAGSNGVLVLFFQATIN
jgi:uncharacterized repeat protein (TIGR01451 family)